MTILALGRLPRERDRRGIAPGAGCLAGLGGHSHAKNTRPGERALATVQRTGGLLPLGSNVFAFGRQQLADGVRSVPRVTSGSQKTGCANRNFGGRSEVPEAGAVPGASGPQAAIATSAHMSETNQRHEFMGVLHDGDNHPPPCGSAASLVIGAP